LAPRKRSGRAAAEAAYADLLKEHTTLVGDVGAYYESYLAKLQAAVAERERYEQARAAAIKAGAVSNEQLDQLGYKKTPKLPALFVDAAANGQAPRSGHSRPRPRSDHHAEMVTTAVGGGHDGKEG